MSRAQAVLLALLALWVGNFYGWATAHVMVASECDRLGGFFVGKRVFECQPSSHERTEGQRP